jgi:hypothetical protein
VVLVARPFFVFRFSSPSHESLTQFLSPFSSSWKRNSSVPQGKHRQPGPPHPGKNGSRRTWRRRRWTPFVLYGNRTIRPIPERPPSRKVTSTEDHLRHRPFPLHRTTILDGIENGTPKERAIERKITILGNVPTTTKLILLSNGVNINTGGRYRKKCP